MDLSGLRDIHLPPPASTPLWIILAVAFGSLALLFLLSFLIYRTRFVQIRLSLRALLYQEREKHFVEGLSETLKNYFGVPTLFQKKWEKFLEHRGLPKETAVLLSEKVYQKNIALTDRLAIVKEVKKIL